MKWLTASTALCGAAVVSAATLPHLVSKRAESLPLESFGSFQTISLDEAKAGMTKSHNMSDTHTDVVEGALRLGTTSSDSESDSTSDVKTFSAASADDGNIRLAANDACAANPNLRFEWRDFSTTDRFAFVAAVRCLMDRPASGNYPPATNRYEDLVRVHQAMVNSIHGNNIFLLWHRYYMWTFEQIMRDECGFNRAFPWWDETLDAGNFAGSSMFTNDFFGSLPGATNGQGTCITDGAFAGRTLHIGPGGGAQDHCLARAVDESLTSQSNRDFVNTCNSRTSYPDMENCAELGPHAYAHNGIGSVMSDVASSPSDPIFFMHHLFIDRNYWAWQNADSSRKTAINGCIDSNNPCTPLTLDTVISVQGLRPDVRVRDVIDPLNGVMCYTYTY